MQQNPFGLNVLDNGVNEGRMWAYLDAARPAASLFMNDHLRAQAAKARYPQMTVIHRTHNDNDAQWHTVTTPQDWIRVHKAYGANGVYVQCYNEPGGDWNNADYRKALMDFWIGAMDEADREGIRLTLPNFSVGNPKEQRILDGSFDPFLKRIAGSNHIFAVHEYFHSDPARETPYLINRISFWQQRAATLGLPPLKIVITEAGMDKGGGRDDGWRKHVSAETYTSQLISTRALYPTKPPVCLFGFGNGYGWDNFNVDDDVVLNTLKVYREDVPVVTEPTPPSFEPCIVTDISGNYVRIRQQPTTASAEIGRLYPESKVSVDVTTLIPTDNDTSKWYRIENPAGYVAHIYKGAPISTIKRATTVPVPALMLDAPYISQEGDKASLRTNDCFIASALMVYQRKLKQAGFGYNLALTVNSVIASSPLENDNDPVSLVEALSFCQTLGMGAEIRQDLTRAKLVQLIDAGIVPIPLVAYKHLNPGKGDFGHYAPVIGYGVTGFWVHDPYLGGAKLYVSNENMERALTDLGTAASGDYQGIVTT